MTTATGMNGQSYVSPQQQIFAGQPQQQYPQQQTIVEQQQQPYQQTIVEQQQIPQQQQQQFVTQQPQQQQQQFVAQQPQQQNYNNGNPVQLNSQNLSMKELSDAGKELLNMFANGQNQNGMPQNGQVMYVPVPQQQSQQGSSFFDGWVGKGVLVGTGLVAGYGVSKIMNGPSGNDIAVLVDGAQTIAQASGDDLIKAIGSFF